MRAAPPLLLAICLSAGCATVPPPPEEAARVEALERALSSGEGDPFELNVKLAKASLDVVNHPLTGSSDRLEFAKKALGFADRAIALEPERVEGHFLRAVSVGLVLDNQTLPQLGLIGELEASGVRARELDASYDGAAPLRLLALLYQKAPAWPLGPELAGEVEEVEALFREAIGLAPDCLENHLCYAEFLLEQDRRAEAREAGARAQALLPTAELGVERPAIERRVRQLLAALRS